MHPKLDDVVAEYESLLTDILQTAASGGDVAQNVLRFRERKPDVARTMTPTEFTLDGAIKAFGLKYTPLSFSNPWKIQENPETKDFEPTHCLKYLVENYSRNFDRSSGAVCRTAVDFILNECLTAMKTSQTTEQSQVTDRSHTIDQSQQTDRPPRTPPPSQDIKVFGELSFSHTITSPTHPRSTSVHSGVIINGRVDHGIGRTLTSLHDFRKRRFQSLLLVVEAKKEGSLREAFFQLVVYLASLHQSRLSRNRRDASVYGAASDGFLWTFVTITHDGTLKRSKQFDIVGGEKDLGMVLGCLKYLLETSASIAGGDDPAINPDDNKFTSTLESGDESQSDS
ncbi:hypothetical protein D9615_006693 [Tricholomella constricta]|uniref:Uncharacterized protein n=1 Tax=Tricholomella constricta TaxID=117010 RepID=A0A8H5H730_9AGAR|nr:hypothetical protein D9615_006693 [Tricholomella constricta]